MSAWTHIQVDNTVMQNLVKKLGFVHCGTIYVEEDNYPRLVCFGKSGFTERIMLQ